MPTPKRYPNPAARQAAYRHRQAAARHQACLAPGVPPGADLPTLPGPRRWRRLTQQSARLLEMVAAEMHEYYDQRSERWQESERGEAFLERLQEVEELQTALAAVSD
jgi:hypothetical protein